MDGAPSEMRPFSGQALSSSVSVLSSSGMPAGLAMFVEPTWTGHGLATARPVPNGADRNMTIGFRPTSAGGRTRAAVRGGAVNLSGQGREVWQVEQRETMSVVPNRSGPAGSMLLGVPVPQRVFRPRNFPPRRFPPGFPIFGPNVDFFGGFRRFGIGCGFFGGCGLLGFDDLGCDPFRGRDCGAFGADIPMYYSVGGAHFGTEEDTSREYGPFAWQQPSAAPSNAPAADSRSDAAATSPDTLIYLKDGSSYAVTDYWLAGYKLHYVTSYGARNSIDLNQLDFQRTVEENAMRGVGFTLRPSPATAPPAAER